MELCSAQSMLTPDIARKIGINACIDRLGRAYVLSHKDSAAAAYGEVPDGVFCFVGIGDAPRSLASADALILDSLSAFPYRTSCTVSLMSGIPVFRECVCPPVIPE